MYAYSADIWGRKHVRHCVACAVHREGVLGVRLWELYPSDEIMQETDMEFYS